MHLLGGFWIAMVSVFFLKKYAKDLFSRHKFIEILFLIGVTMIVGFGWEFYEFLADTFVFHHSWLQANSLDTITDLTADFFGALIYALVKKR